MSYLAFQSAVKGPEPLARDTLSNCNVQLQLYPKITECLSNFFYEASLLRRLVYHLPNSFQNVNVKINESFFFLTGGHGFINVTSLSNDNV